MKYLIFVFTFFICGCWFEMTMKKVYTKQLKDNSIIEVYYSGGGATADDIIWIRKISGNKKKYIGKIKWADNYQIDIYEINDSLINIKFTDTTIYKSKFREFKINTNNKIEPNDGSMFADSTY
ncbi:MAG: hypothetical protein QM737_15970 [Ferruginibacter sp.]